MSGIEAEMSSPGDANGKEPENIQNAANIDLENGHSQPVLANSQDGDGSVVFAPGTDWTEVRKSNKRQKISSSGVSRDTFKSLDIHDKLAVLHVDILDQKEKVANIESKVDTCLRLHTRVNTIERNLGDADRRLLLLEYKTSDLESRSRRNNLIFNGFGENRQEVCSMTIENFLEATLEVQPFAIDRAHRLGRYTRDSNRPIIVAFRDYTAVETVLSNAYKLKGSDISINRDFPKEIVAARKSLWKEYKDLKADYPQSKVSLVYPAKIKKDGRVIADRFPLWHDIMSGSRIAVPQRPRSNAANDRGSRAQSNFCPSQTASADGMQTDPLIAHVPPAVNTDNASSDSPPRSNFERRQSRSPNRRARTRTSSGRSRAHSRYQWPSNLTPTRRSSSIHRPWDRNMTLPQESQQSATE